VNEVGHVLKTIEEMFTNLELRLEVFLFGLKSMGGEEVGAVLTQKSGYDIVLLTNETSRFLF
jgi:hypothetical protein